MKHERLIDSLQLGHGIIIAGVGESEKQNAARKVVKRALCVGTKEKSCTCPACTTPLQQNPDVLLIKPAEGKQSIGVEAADRIKEFCSYCKTVSAVKVIYVDGLDRMTVQAQNSLLKTLEDNAVQNVLVATAGDGPILETVRTRTQTIEILGMDRKSFFSKYRDDLLYEATGGSEKDVPVIKDNYSFYENVARSIDTLDILKLVIVLGLIKEKGDKESFFMQKREEVPFFFRLIENRTARHAEDELESNPNNAYRWAQISELAAKKLLKVHSFSFGKNEFFGFITELDEIIRRRD